MKTPFPFLAAALTARTLAGKSFSTKGSSLNYTTTINGLDILSASAHEVALALESGTLSSLDLVDAYISRIEANDRTGLNLRSIIEVAPTAREIAHQLDEQRRDGTKLSPLHGVPIVVKDNFNTDVSLGMNTTAGSYSLYRSHAKGDAFVVEKLRAAGVLIMGKANLHEFAGERGIANSSAWSAVGGQCQSAYVFGGFEAGGDPSGSSSGSAVAVSAGFAAASLGSDTEGSIVSPANRAALYGLRPSTGIPSRTGVVPISSTQDTTGPIAKSTWDIAALLEIMVSHDPEDSYSLAAEPYRHSNYTQFLDSDGLARLRIGIPREPFWNQTFQGYRSGINAGLEATFSRMRELGATIIDPIEFPNAERWKYSFPGGAERVNDAVIVLQHDLKEDMAEYLTTQRTNMSGIETLRDIINFNDANADLEFPPGQCCQDTFTAANEVDSRNVSADYWKAKFSQQQLNEEGIEWAFREYSLDLLLVPTEGNAARLGAVGRCPVGNVPVGYDDINLPYGMSFVGKRYDEPTVIRAMSGYEANFEKRHPPPTLD